MINNINITQNDNTKLNKDILPYKDNLLFYYDKISNSFVIRDHNGEDRHLNIIYKNYILGENIGTTDDKILCVGNHNINKMLNGSIGYNNEMNGTGSLSIGFKNITNSNYSFSTGKYTKVDGDSSFVGGSGYSSIDKKLYLEASGDFSFNFSTINSVYTGFGSSSRASAILAGLNNSIDKGSNNSVIIGGENNKIKNNVKNAVILGGNGIVAKKGNTVYCENLVLNNLTFNKDVEDDSILCFSKKKTVFKKLENSGEKILFGKGQRIFKISHNLKIDFPIVMLYNNRTKISISNYTIKSLSKTTFNVIFSKPIGDETYHLVYIKGGF